jgi:hypothetical protein
MEVLQVTEYKEEGIAIIEDARGKYIVTEKSPNFIPLYDYESLVKRRTPCALLRNRESMLT